MRSLLFFSVIAVAGCAVKPSVPMSRVVEEPPMPQFSALSASAVPAPVQFSLSWSNYPAGVSNAIVSGSKPQSLTSTQYVGVTNFAVINQTEPVGYYQVVPMLGTARRVPSNVVSYPGKKVRQMRHATYSGNQVLSDVVLLTFTNTPPGTHAQTYWKEWDDYSP